MYYLIVLPKNIDWSLLFFLEWQYFDLKTSNWKVVTAGHSHGNRNGYYWSTRKGKYAVSTQTISDFPAGNYTFQYEWSAFGGSKQSCSNIRIQPFQWRVPPFDWTTTTVEYFSEVPFKIGTIQTCWGYGGEIRLRTLKWMRKKGTCSLHLLISYQDTLNECKSLCD